MEIWIGGKKRWIKEPFKPFPGNEPLISILKEHQKKYPKTEHWLVFSNKEEESLKKMMSPFYPSHMPVYHFLDAICTPLKEIFAPPPFVTTVPLDYEKPLAEQSEFRVAIKFNHKY